MKLLFQVALENRKHYLLLLITLFATVLMSLAAQMEMFTLGFLVNTTKGSDFFELFGPEEKGKIQTADQISFDEVSNRWTVINGDVNQPISKKDAENFLKYRSKTSLHQQIMTRVGDYLGVSKSLYKLLIIFIFVALFKVICTFMGRYTMTLVGIKVSRDLRQKYFEHIQVLPMSFYQKYNIGSLSARVSGDAGIVADSISSFIINYLQTPFTILSSLCLLFYLSWKLSLLIFIGLPLLVLPIMYLARKVKKISKQIQQTGEQFATVLIDFLSGIQTVKLFVMEEFSLKKYKEQNNRSAKLEEKSARYGYSSRPILHMIGTLFLGFVILYGLYVADMSLSDLVVYVGFLHLFYEPIKKFSEENLKIQKGIAAAERMFEVLNIKPDIEDKPGAVEFTKFSDSIEFDNVWFKYEESWILKGLSFTVKKGETVALVGPTGAGKSTIAQLIPRLYEVNQGDIRIDGISIADYKQRSLREHIAFVPQKPFLFIDTVSQNIAFGRAFTPAQIQEAAIKAYADEFIQNLNGKYNSVLLEAGKSLSGGQQQRLAIARALVKNAPILIMDEATSSLDTVSENRIKQAIDALKGKMTQIIIAHRLSTIEDADKIIYLEHGRKIAEGKKDELLKTCSGFKLMWDMMYRNEKASEKEKVPLA